MRGGGGGARGLYLIDMMAYFPMDVFLEWYFRIRWSENKLLRTIEAGNPGTGERRKEEVSLN